ncbi:hypothetical protein G6M89_14770 [Natronolimnobius sp. AArcel1]|uniref:hypothetical protein n=1 Tax=Natronolimnobius sp. AArcel1 TaxID=1679093 RepID=UPI0013EC5773|nr:hypothetical protein [Natronolimnobius sp. AArcel1]NGM70257.1 hypothetical protein [Natronolimnobius sp. AArcel1]
MIDDLDSIDDLKDVATSRRSILVATGGVGAVSGLGLGYILFSGNGDEPDQRVGANDSPTMYAVTDLPTSFTVRSIDTESEGVTISGSDMSLQVLYTGFDSGEVDDVDEFNVSIAVKPDFASEAETLVSGSFGVEDTPSDSLFYDLDADVFDSNTIDLAAHSGVSDDYAEFAPEEGEDQQTTAVEFEITVESQSFDLTSTATYASLVTATRGQRLSAGFDTFWDGFVAETDHTGLSAMYFDGEETEFEIEYEGFDDVSDDDPDTFTISVFARPEFADEKELIGSTSIESSEESNESLSGTFAGEELDLANHSEVSSDFGEFEPSDDDVTVTLLEIEIRVESEQYDLSYAQSLSNFLLSSKSESSSNGNGDDDDNGEDGDDDPTPSAEIIIEGTAGGTPTNNPQ